LPTQNLGRVDDLGTLSVCILFIKKRGGYIFLINNKGGIFVESHTMEFIAPFYYHKIKKQIAVAFHDEENEEVIIIAYDTEGTPTNIEHVIIDNDYMEETL
tara:strand:+ start:13358 stop:13660 length:303 start_codon:yes stop_codon:yes gene_type:complete